MGRATTTDGRRGPGPAPDEELEGHGRSASDVLDGIRWLIGLRWVSAAAILLAAPLLWLTPKLFGAVGADLRLELRAPVTALVGFAALITLLNAAYWALWRHLAGAPPSQGRTRLVRLLANAQVALDLLTITSLVHFLGGFESPAPLFMIFHMICVASIVTQRAAYLQAALGLVLLATLAHLEASGVVPHRSLVVFDPPVRLHGQSSYLGVYLVITAGMLGITVFLTNYLADKVRREQRRVWTAEVEAMTDGLTGLANHRHFQRRFAEERERARRHGFPVSVVILDVDHFKRFNDDYGHLAGDRVLREVAGVLDDEVRASDLAARYGGEEFVLLLPGTEPGPAREVADRTRRRVAEHRFDGELPEEGRHVTVSAGVATWRPADGESRAQGLIARADEALYEAKESGRDRVCVAGDDRRASTGGRAAEAAGNKRVS